MRSRPSPPPNWAAARGALALLLQRSAVAGHVDGQSVLGGDVPRQVQRKAVGVPQAEGRVAGQHRLAARLDRGHQLLQQGQAQIQGAQEALLLVLDGRQDEVGPLAQIGVGIAHLVDDRAADLVQEGLGEAQQPAIAGRAAQHQAQDIVAPLVARQHAVADQEGDGAGVVGDDAVGDDLGGHLDVAVAE